MADRPEFRRDIITGNWVIFPINRKSPSEYRISPKPEERHEFCPLCEGNEGNTPPELYAVRKPGTQPNTRGWTVRVVWNKFPVLHPDFGRRLYRERIGLHESMNALGSHEVLIATPEHIESLASLEVKQLSDVFQGLCGRYKELSKDPRYEYISAGHNRGRMAGATMEHACFQIFAVPIVPRAIGEELSGAESYMKYEKNVDIAIL